MGYALIHIRRCDGVFRGFQSASDLHVVGLDWGVLVPLCV